MTSAVPAPSWCVSLARARRRRACTSLGLALALAPAITSAAPAPADAEAEDPAPTDAPADDAAPADPADAATDTDPADPETPDAPEDAEPASEDPEDAPETDPETDEETEEDPEGPVEGPEEPEDPDDVTVDEPDGDAEPIRPPRFDGPYIGVVAVGSMHFASVLNHDTPSPLFGPMAFLQAGDAVFPWMSIGVAAGGGGAFVGDQKMFEGALLVEFGWVPVQKYPLSIRTGFGFGGGALTQAGIDERSGFGGAVFKGAVRYEFFPLAEKKRATRGGGWAIGPELGWLGATPAGKGQPYVNTVTLGLSTSFYFGS